MSALLDSGTTGMFINCTFVQKHKLETQPLPNPVPVHNVNGAPNENGSIMEEVKVIQSFASKIHTPLKCTLCGYSSTIQPICFISFLYCASV